MGCRGAVCALFIAAVVTAGTSIRADATLSVLPEDGTQRSYTWTWESVAASLRYVSHAHFTVTRTGAGEISVTDSEHAAHAVRLALVDGGFGVDPRAMLAYPFGSTSIVVASGVGTPTVARSARAAFVHEVRTIPVPPVEYRDLVTLVAGMRDAIEGSERSVEGCGGSDVWYAQIAPESTGERRLSADCDETVNVRTNANRDVTSMKFEKHLEARFDVSGRLHDAHGTTRRQVRSALHTYAMDDSWTIAADPPASS